MVNLFLPYWSCLQFYFSLRWNVLRKESLLLSIFTLGITEILQRPSTVVRALQFVWPSIQFFSFLILFIYPYMLSDSVRWSQLLRGGKSYLFIIFIGCVCGLITHWQIYMWLQKRLWVSVEKRSITISQLREAVENIKRRRHQLVLSPCSYGENSKSERCHFYYQGVSVST